MNKQMIILRGSSGSGKSTFARTVLRSECKIFSADDYFYDNHGSYIFDVKKLPFVHKKCQNVVEYYAAMEYPFIVIDNTNTSENEVKPYENIAKKYNYMVFRIVVEDREDSQDVHNVPKDVKISQRKKLIRSLNDKYKD